jgi:hypothetical protein
MKRSNWKDTAELVGIAAIVASLIFVGLQMRQSHEIALVTLYQMRADAAREVMVASLQSDGLVRAFERMDAGESPTPADTYFLETSLQLLFNHFENSHFLYQRGFLTEEHWLSDIANLTSTLMDPEAREIWDATKHVYRTSYVDAIDEALQGLQSD